MLNSRSTINFNHCIHQLCSPIFNTYGEFVSVDLLRGSEVLAIVANMQTNMKAYEHHIISNPP